MSKAKAMLKKLREKKGSGVKTGPYTYLSEEEKIERKQKQEEENEIDPLDFLSKHSLEIKPKDITELIKTNNKEDDDEKEESEDEKKLEPNRTSFILRFIHNTPSKTPDDNLISNTFTDEIPNTNDTTENLLIDNQIKETNLTKIDEEEKESCCNTSRTYRANDLLNMSNPVQIHQSSKNIKEVNKSLTNEPCQTTRPLKTTNNKHLISNKSYIQKVHPVKKKRKFTQANLVRTPQSFQSLTIKQRSLLLLSSAKKMNEPKQTNKILPKKISMPELTEEQKIKFDLRMRKIKKKKMFTSRITSNKGRIATKIKELCQKYDNNLSLKTMIDDVVTSCEFPELNIIDEDIENEGLNSNMPIKKIESKTILNVLKKDQLS